LSISSKLNLQQSASSAGQPIRQTPPVTSQPNAQCSFGAGTAMALNPQPRTSKEQPLETPSAEIQAIERISAKMKSHVKQELMDHFSEMLQKQYGIKPKQ
jgi:hypothetical protein